LALPHGHEHEEPVTEAEREELVTGGATCQEMVIRSELSPADSRMSQVRVSVRFKDGAPVDQARASRDADPKCEFCRQPLPVSPQR